MKKYWTLLAQALSRAIYLSRRPAVAFFILLRNWVAATRQLVIMNSVTLQIREYSCHPEDSRIYSINNLHLQAKLRNTQSAIFHISNKNS